MMRRPPRVPLPVSGPGLLRVTERYACFEGEGSTLGVATFLVRLSGCDLRCHWCDSKQSSFREDEARQVGADALEHEALAAGTPWVSFTGGEPTWRGSQELRALGALCRALRARGLKVKVETNGRRLPRELSGCVDLWSVSPKWDGRRPGAAARTPAMDYDETVLARLVRGHAASGRLQVKFVVTFDSGRPRPGDLERAAGLLHALPKAVRGAPVYFIPEAYASGPYLERCKALEAAVAGLLRGPLRGFNAAVQPQWHRVLHGDQRGR